MKYEINTLVATLVDNSFAKKGSIGAIIGQKDDNGSTYYLVELFLIKNHPHLQLFYKEDQIYAIDNK